MCGPRGLPAVRKKFLDPTSGMGRYALEDISKISIRIVSVELGRLDEAHDGGGTLASAQRSRKEPVAAAERDRADAVFDVIVVDRQIAIFEVASERCPTAQAVIDCFAGSRPVRHLPSLASEPLAQGFGNGPCAL